MSASVEQAKSPERKPSPPRVKQYAGEVVYIYAFDVAYDMTRKPVRELLGQPVAQFVVDASKRSPRQLFFYRPQMVRLPPLERIGPHGPVRVERVIKLLPVGAISISVRVPFAVQQIEDLVAYHDLQFSNGSLSEEVRRLAEEVRGELAAHYVQPVRQLAEEEAYTVFCIESPLLTEENAELNAESWWRAHRRAVASLLTQEPDIDHLSKQEADESTGRFLTYYQHDLVVCLLYTSVKCVINCDGHRFEHAGFLRLGAGIARKGWLTKEDVVNTLPLDKLRKELGRKRAKLR